MKYLQLFFIVLIGILPGCNQPEQTDSDLDSSIGKLKVSDNRRFLVFEDGTPFFYLGDTAWELFHRLNKEETGKYFENRRERGFTVIQAVALAELDGLNTPNAEGETPLIDNNPEHPNEKYFAHVDWVIRKAEEKGLYIGLLPTWGDKWNVKWGEGPLVFTPENAGVFGRFLGERYKDFKNIIWIIGGDRPLEEDVHREILVAMANGLRSGDGGAHLITFHPQGGQGSAQYFHDEEWLDFNMRQNGHNQRFTGVYENISKDYGRTPVKPVMDGEPIYEDHPIEFRPDNFGHSISADVRRPLYWNLFSGAFGHTYGHHSVWQMWQPGRNPVNRPLMPWYDAINQPGAAQMQYGRWLLESRPFLSRIPDNSMIVNHEYPSSLPGAGVYTFVATRDQEGTYAMIYAPVGRSFQVKMDVIKGDDVIAWWYNPRNGEATKIGLFPNTGSKEFCPPEKGEVLDWVLVLDDASKKYPEPGSRRK
ncbi:MAG: glycoside hydrolase family 140 protein [Mariniphaga sp.]|nr:glycoside hydrolase family 140 protein [Mariniphaga sp.]MDD4425628.1 glycoside hydrolase family 140 protein [Mariniphaga sp.]